MSSAVINHALIDGTSVPGATRNGRSCRQLGKVGLDGGEALIHFGFKEAEGVRHVVEESLILQQPMPGRRMLIRLVFNLMWIILVFLPYSVMAIHGRTTRVFNHLTRLQKFLTSSEPFHQFRGDAEAICQQYAVAISDFQMLSCGGIHDETVVTLSKHGCMLGDTFFAAVLTCLFQKLMVIELHANACFIFLPILKLLQLSLRPSPGSPLCMQSFLIVVYIEIVEQVVEIRLKPLIAGCHSERMASDEASRQWCCMLT